jgi:HAE1 family hydrophobic/amphiphilic exporter-1
MKQNINSRIASYFLNNSRVTALGLLVLTLAGIFTFLSLRTTGFPSPSINFVIATTIYPGASANTVVEQVTKPIETAVKDVEGVKSYSSTSGDSFSNVVVQIDENENLDAVKAKIDTTIRSVTLPAGIENTEIFSPRVSGDEYFYTLIRNDGTVNNEETFTVLDTLKTELEKDTDVSKVNLDNAIAKKVVITVDEPKMGASGLTYTDILNQLRTWGLAIPVTQNATIDQKQTDVTLSIDGATLTDLRNILLFSTSRPGAPVRLSDIAAVDFKYLAEKDNRALVAYREGEEKKVTTSYPFTIDTTDSANLATYDSELKSLIAKYFDQNSEDFKKLSDAERQLFSKYTLKEVFTVANSNKEQVQEVEAGLIGEKWEGLGNLKWIGFLFGGIQLVFLIMLALVSWRAAIIAALAIPLSFFFSVIWVKLTGNDLNTLVLFSLVLVIGLVVDPALVVLESIQRNLDSGYSGKESVVKAFNEIGSGLLLAVLTSVLVFVPFGVVSGIFGEIISYIPLTILPALVGSYIVPLVFLSWLASIFLKRSKKSSDDEEKNLWGLARGMIRLNTRILHAPAIIRLVIIIISLVVPLGIAGYYTTSGKVKQVQFAQPEESEFLILTAQNLPQKTADVREQDDRALVDAVIQNKFVKKVAPYEVGSNANTYIVQLNERGERGGYTSAEINQQIRDVIDEKAADKFFNVDISVSGVGPGGSSFPIAIAVKTDDLGIQKQVSTDILNILNSVCKKDEKGFELKKDCGENERVVLKVDNGYEGKGTSFVEVKLNRQKTNINPVNPIDVRTILASQFSINEGKKAATFKDGNADLDIVLEKSAADPTSIDQIKSLPLRTLDGRAITLADIADVNLVNSVNAIRRVGGETVGVVSAKVTEVYSDAGNTTLIQNAVIKEFNDNYATKYSNVVVENYSEGDAASFARSFTELGIAFLLAIVLTYVVLVVFFNSFSQPLVILFSIPLTFIGIFPALAAFAGGQLGFLEIIGIIILVGLVENVAIFLLDAANQKIREEGWDPKRAIAYASGVRFRPIILTKLTTLVSTAPLAILSETYRSLSVVIIFGLLTSGIVSLVTSPILYIYFKNLSGQFRGYSWWKRGLFLLTLPLALLLVPLYNGTRRLLSRK